MGAGASANSVIKPQHLALMEREKKSSDDSLSGLIVSEYLSLSEVDKKLFEEGLIALIGNGLTVNATVDTLSSKPARVLYIAHFNDAYNLNSVYREEPKGGARRFAAALKTYKQQVAVLQMARPLVLFSGDFVGPSLMSSVTKGAHLIDTLNALGCDYATFGNHELDYGYESLKNRLEGIDTDVLDTSIGWNDYETSETQWIMTNMTEVATGLPMGGPRVSKYALFDWGGGVGVTSTIKPMKVGLLAVSEDWLQGCSQLPPNTIAYEDFIESARKMAHFLRKSGADVIIAITHNRLANDYKLTSAVPEIDLLLGGHDHFYKADLDHRIVKSGEEWRWLSKIKIEIPASVGDGNIITKPIVTLETVDVLSTMKEDLVIDSICDKYDQFAKLKFNNVLFQTSFDLNPMEEYVRYQETLVVNWICDCCADDYSLNDGIQSIDITILQGYQFTGKATIPAGDFTLGHLFSMFTKSYAMVVLRLTGQEIIQTLTHGCASLPRECGSLCHVSANLSYSIILPNPCIEGSFSIPVVTNVLYCGQPIDVNAVYSVSMTSTFAKGKYGFDWLERAPRVIDEEFAPQLIDLVQMYCLRYKGKPGKYPAVATTGRIKVI